MLLICGSKINRLSEGNEEIEITEKLINCEIFTTMRYRLSKSENSYEKKVKWQAKKLLATLMRKQAIHMATDITRPYMCIYMYIHI